MNREECRRQRSWPVSENHPGIFVEALRTTKAIPRIVGVPTGTRTGYLTDANQKGSCLQQLTLQHHINFLRPTGHYMYRPVVTTCTVQWSVDVKPRKFLWNVAKFDCLHKDWTINVSSTGGESRSLGRFLETWVCSLLGTDWMFESRWSRNR